MPLSTELAANKQPLNKRRTTPLWKGPEEDGITFSLLSRFLVCRERFRLLVVEGLKPADSFNHRLEYGNMWHVCEEAAAAEVKHFGGELRGVDTTLWEDNLKGYCQKLCKRYPTQQEQVDHWYHVCRVQFPLYVLFWQKHPDVVNRTPLLQEHVFSVPYKLPSGRIVKLRGKWDSVDLSDGSVRTDLRRGMITKPAGIELQENKTKGDINEQQIKRQLTFDLQTMLYLIALEEARSNCNVMDDRWNKIKIHHISGVRYNVIRRPLSGGKGTIKRHKPSKSNPQGESKEHFYARLAQDIKDEPEHYFMRWKCEVSPADITKFRRECLDPILEQLCGWWEWITNPRAGRGIDMVTGNSLDPYKVMGNGYCMHWRYPFGVYNPLTEGLSSDLDAYLDTGSRAGLQVTDTLFPELI